MSLHRIYILPTRSWTYLLTLLGVMWYAAISQSNSAAYLLMFFLGSLVLVTAIHAHFALAGLRLRTGRPEPTFAGGAVRVPVEVVNGSGSARTGLALAPRGCVFREEAHVAVPALAPGAGGAAEVSLPVRHRGLFTVGRLALTTVYPLGFFRAWRYEPADASCLVYPLPAGPLPLPGGENFTADLADGAGAGGDDYSGARPYQTGESQRHVDWRAAARGQGLLVKQFTGAGSRRLWFDLAATARLGDLETRLSQLCRWVVDAEAGDAAYGLRLPGFEAAPARGFHHYHRCLGALATFEEPAGGSAGPA